MTTTGKAAKLKAEVNREGMTANGTDLAYVTVSVTDAEGNVIPNATNNVTFKVTGSGSLAGIDNGSSPDHQSYRDDNRDAFSGQLVGIVRAGEKAGDATVTVSADASSPPPSRSPSPPPRMLPSEDGRQPVLRALPLREDGLRARASRRRSGAL